MIFVNHFKKHLELHPKIAAAFEIRKSDIRELYKNRENADELYKIAVSNFIHGAFRCSKETEHITSYGRLHLRTANINDYDFIDTAERDDDNNQWVGNWTLGLRIEMFGDNNFFQTIIENNEGCKIGFIDFRDMMHDTQVELKRIVITNKGKAYGKEAMYLSQKFAFEILGRNRLYLGTKDANVRAQHVYHGTGFTLVNPENIASFQIFKEDYIKQEQLI